ncbi:MAG: hypothetical protein JWO60_3124 [Frankiales bacterium]|nr:hypothetical protein [Frankiales bacterium]
MNEAGRDLNETPLAAEEVHSVRELLNATDPLQGASLYTVEVLAAPVRLWSESADHIEELMREFALLRISSASGTTRPVPQRLLDLVAELRSRYAGTSTAQELEFDAAVDEGRESLDLTYQVPAGVGQACLELSDLLDEADAYCANGGMITMIAPPEQAAFRRWYLGEFASQEAGEPPTPWAAYWARVR